MGWSLAEILTATGGKLDQAGQRSRYGEVVTDSGKVKKGSVFIALKGERHDGHSFVAEAARRGAACVIVHREVSLPTKSTTIVRVGDTLRALGDMAHYRREQYGPKVLAIGGANGKTTTKEMVAAILEEGSLDGRALRGKVLKTEGNFNNLVGLPLTLLRLRRQDRVAVVELGTNHPGEIERLAEIADADMGIITSISAEHLEGLKSLAGVAREEGALFRSLRANGAIAVNLDDPWVRRLGARFRGKKFTYGKGGWLRAGDYRLRNASGVDVTFSMARRRCRVRLNYLGRHNVTNALGAAALTVGAGVSLAAVRRGLAKAKPYSMRMQLDSWRGVGIINDAYNANPASMQAALATLTEIPGRGKKLAVLGDMFELGRHSRREHLQLGKVAARAKLDRLFLLGAQAELVRRGAIGAGMAAAKITVGKDHVDIAAQLGGLARRGDWLLVKGSRSMRMEKVLHELKGGKA
jgi:UDP-N-acetylmuramoyl-tripeptide--D-alanyl-D-alanine ligase